MTENTKRSKPPINSVKSQVRGEMVDEVIFVLKSGVRPSFRKEERNYLPAQVPGCKKYADQLKACRSLASKESVIEVHSNPGRSHDNWIYEHAEGA